MGEHLVQFYDDDAFIVNEIWDFISPCLRRGETAVVIATQARLGNLAHKFISGQLHTTSLRPAIGKYMPIDAAATLSQLLVDGLLDEARFKTIVGSLLRRASKDGEQHVHIYGEMVALLCAEGKQAAAIRLEQFWTELAQEYPFTLLCSYPMHVFTRAEDAQAFGSICEAHTHVRPAESYSEPHNEEALHRTIALLQQKARALESEVAQRKAIEHALRCREQELADIDRRKDEFLAMLGHELRNPLAPIMNSLELMRIHGDLPEQTARARATIARQVALMTRLVDDLLDVSRITRGKIDLKMEDVALDHIVERAVEIACPLINERHHQLTLNLPAQAIRLHGDAARLAQVLANLLHNAAKYTDPGGSISLTAREEEQSLVLIVGDNGIGLDMELQDKVFDLFVQDTKSLNKARGGLGLGLTLVRSLVQLHGGTVGIRSEGQGHGSEFIVTLPLRSPSQGDVLPALTTASDSQDAMPRNILIVDDNIDAAESLGEFLKIAGHLVHVVHDGATAIRDAAYLRPEIVILDIGMPAMDGYRVAQSLRTEVGLNSSLLIAVTGYAQERDRISAQNAGFDYHFAKPIDIEKLVTLLRTHVQ